MQLELCNDPSKDWIEDNLSIVTPAIFGFPKFEVPELYYDNDTLKKKSYGTLETKEVIEQLNKIADKYMEKHPEEKFLIHHLTNYEAKYYLPDKMGEFEGWEKDLADEAWDVFGKEKCTVKISGEYFSDKNQIVIYRKAFEKYKDEEKKAKLWNTYFHELFHAIHYQLAPNTFHENTFEAEVVREALADYYAYSVSLYWADLFKSEYAEDAKAHRSVAMERKAWWRKWLLSTLPYAKAIFCEYHGRGQENCNGRGQENCSNFNDCEKTGAIDKLKKVLDLSKTDMRAAYEELVPEGFRQDGGAGGSHGYYDGQSFYILVDVMLGHAYYTYRFDPHSGGVATGDKVVCHSSNGRDSEAVVRSVRIVYEDEYRKICRRCGMLELSTAERV